MFREALFYNSLPTITQTLIDCRVDRLYIHTVKYHTVRRKNKLLLHLKMWYLVKEARDQRVHKLYDSTYIKYKK